MLPPLITAIDQKYLPYLAVLVASLAEFGRGCRLVVIHRNVSDDERQGVESLAADLVSLTWVAATPGVLRAYNLSALANVETHYLRLLAGMVLPQDRRAIYIDADTLIRADPTPLLRWPLQKYPLAAVQDYLGHVANGISNYATFGLDPGSPYFNSGVMVMDLDFWRQKDVAAAVLVICKENTVYLQAQGRWPQYDQFGLNIVFSGNWMPLPRIWNHGSELPDDGAKIVHFIGNGKPDSEKCQKNFSREFFARLAGTPWRDSCLR